MRLYCQQFIMSNLEKVCDIIQNILPHHLRPRFVFAVTIPALLSDVSIGRPMESSVLISADAAVVDSSTGGASKFMARLGVGNLSLLCGILCKTLCVFRIIQDGIHSKIWRLSIINWQSRRNTMNRLLFDVSHDRDSIVQLYYFFLAPVYSSRVQLYIRSNSDCRAVSVQFAF